MAHLKTFERQIAAPAAPDLSKAAAGTQAGNMAVQAAIKTTAHYVDSANKVKSELLYTDATNALNRELVKDLSTENIAKGNSYARYIEKSQAIKEGILGEVPAKYHSDVSNMIDQQINKLGLKVATQELAYAESQTKAQSQVILAEQMKALKEAIASGNHDEAAIIKENTKRSLANQKDIGIVDDYDIHRIEQKLDDEEKIGTYSAVFEDLLRKDPEEATRYLNDLANNRPENLSYEQWKSTQATLNQQYADYNRSVSASQSLGQSEYKLALDAGQIKSPEDLELFIAQKEGEGRYFSPEAKVDMQDALVRQTKANSKDSSKLLAIDNAVANNPDDLYNFSKGDLNKWYLEKSSYLNQQYEKIKAENPNAQVPSPLAVKASIASQVPVKIDSFNNEMDDKLRFGNIQDVEDAIKTGIALEKNSPKTFSKLDTDTKVYFDKASKLYGNTGVGLEQIKVLTDKALSPKDSESQRKIEKALADIHNKTATFKDLYHDIYRTNYVNPSQQPQFDNMVKVYDAFFMSSNGDKATAAKLTRNYMQPNSGKSKYIPKNDVTKHPLEETEIYQKHPTFVKNQIGLAMVELINLNDKAKDIGYSPGHKFEWPDDVPRPNIEGMSEKDVYDKLIWVDKAGKEVSPHIKVDDKNRKLFLMNPNQDLEDERPDQRQFHYEDEWGRPQPIYVASEETQPNGKKRIQSGVYSIDFMSPEQLIPNEYKNIKMRESKKEAKLHLQTEFAENEKPKPTGVNEIAVRGLPERPNPLKQAADIKKKLDAEDKYVMENLPERVGRLDKAKAKQIKILIGKGNNE